MSAPVVIHSSRRDPYLESSSSGRHALDGYQEFSTSYSRVPSRRLYDDDSYVSQYEYYEDDPVATYDYPDSSSKRRRYSSMVSSTNYWMPSSSKTGFKGSLVACFSKSGLAFLHFSAEPGCGTFSCLHLK